MMVVMNNEFLSVSIRYGLVTVKCKVAESVRLKHILAILGCAKCIIYIVEFAFSILKIILKVTFLIIDWGM